MKAQKRGKEQQFDIMNKQYKQLESRLDEILSRIAKETEEIKDLEQQLTEGENSKQDLRYISFSVSKRQMTGVNPSINWICCSC